jgi:hypothetical protein
VRSSCPRVAPRGARAASARTRSARRERPDQVAPREGRRLCGHAPLADDLADDDRGEVLLRKELLLPQQRGDQLTVQPDGRGALPPLGELVVSSCDLAFALARGQHRDLVAVPAVDAEGLVHGGHLTSAPAELLAHRTGDPTHLEGPVRRHIDGDAELAHQLVAEDRLAHRASRGGVAVQGWAVHLAPGAVVTEHEVWDRDVCVELGVDGDLSGPGLGDRTRGVVVELGQGELGTDRDHIAQLAVVAASPARVRLEILAHRVDRGLMGAHHRVAGGIVANGPEQRDALRRAEGDIERDHRLTRPAALHQLGAAARVATVQQRPQLFAGDLAAEPEVFRSGSHPAPRCVTADRVVLHLNVVGCLDQIAHHLIDVDQLPDRYHRPQA